MRARSGGETAARRAGAAADGGERRRPSREGEGSGLGAKSITGREMKLPAQGIGAALTGDGESATGRELGAAASMEEGARVWVGKERGSTGRG
jgi:hypothetical protein